MSPAEYVTNAFRLRGLGGPISRRENSEQRITAVVTNAFRLRGLGGPEEQKQAMRKERVTNAFRLRGLGGHADAVERLEEKLRSPMPFG